MTLWFITFKPSGWKLSEYQHGQLCAKHWTELWLVWIMRRTGNTRNCLFITNQQHQQCWCWGEVRRGEVSVLRWPWLVLIKTYFTARPSGLTQLQSPAAPSLSWLSSEFKYISKCELSNHSAFSQRGPCQHTPASRLLLTLSLTRYRLYSKTCQVRLSTPRPPPPYQLGKRNI